MYQDVSELHGVYENNALIIPLCDLIKNKCFSENDSKKSFSFKLGKVHKLKIEDIKKLARVDCVFDGKIEFNFTMLFEYLELEGKSYITAFVYNMIFFTNYVNLTFKACLPLLEYPDPPEAK